MPVDPDRETMKWLLGLLDSVAACFEAESPMGLPGMRYREEDGFWEISIYPTPVELVGGRHDGAVVEAGFTVDLDHLRSLFESITAFGWNALGLHFPEGPHVYIEGVHEGRELLLQVLAHPPEDEDAGIKVDTSGGPPRLA